MTEEQISQVLRNAVRELPVGRIHSIALRIHPEDLMDFLVNHRQKPSDQIPGVVFFPLWHRGSFLVFQGHRVITDVTTPRGEVHVV